MYVPTDRYIYYDDQGEITSISNTNDLEGNYILLPLEKVINFLTGKESASSYIVIYDTLLKQNVLKLKYQSDEMTFYVNDDIFKVPQELDGKPDLIITQDIKNKKWIFTVDQGLQSYLKSQVLSYNKKIHISITRKNDPHDLYHLIIFDFDKLINDRILEVPFRYQSEESETDLSVYTSKRFETYVYEVKND